MKLGETVSFSREKGPFCKTCCEAKVASGFLKGKVWTECKVDYLKIMFSRKVIIKNKIFNNWPLSIH